MSVPAVSDSRCAPRGARTASRRRCLSPAVRALLKAAFRRRDSRIRQPGNNAAGESASRGAGVDPLDPLRDPCASVGDKCFHRRVLGLPTGAQYRARRCSSLAEHQLPQLNTRVRFPSSAPSLPSAPTRSTSRPPDALLPLPVRSHAPRAPSQPLPSPSAQDRQPWASHPATARGFRRVDPRRGGRGRSITRPRHEYSCSPMVTHIATGKGSFDRRTKAG